MIIVGVVAATLAAFVLSSVYYTAVTPLERRVLGDAALDRGRPQIWKVLAEVLRTAVVASVFAWVASRAALESLPGSLELAAAVWIGFPVVLLTGSILWERVAPVTAMIHAGDWLLKVVLFAVVIGLLH
jgi:hypothetical protein